MSGPAADLSSTRASRELPLCCHRSSRIASTNIAYPAYTKSVCARVGGGVTMCESQCESETHAHGVPPVQCRGRYIDLLAGWLAGFTIILISRVVANRMNHLRVTVPAKAVLMWYMRSCNTSLCCAAERRKRHSEAKFSRPYFNFRAEFGSHISTPGHL